jgi:ligand-binding sensor domain-containing protein
VARYDGARFVRFEPANGTSAPFDTAQLIPSPDGTLMIATAYGDPACLRGEILTSCLAPGSHLPRSDRLIAVATDKEAIWLGTRHHLLRYEKGRLTMERNLAELGFGRITAFLRDRQGRLWVAGTNGLYLYDGGKFQLHTGPEGPVNTQVSALFEGPRALWATASNLLLRIAADGSTTYDARDLLPVGRLGAVIEDRDGNVWIGTETGLLRMRDGRFTRFGRNDGLPDEHITALFEDREGSLWVGTRSGGIAQFTDRTLVTSAGPPGLRGQQVDTVCETPDGSVWLGTARLGLWRWKDGVATAYGTAEGLPTSHVTAVLPGRPGELWVGTSAGMVRWRDGHTDRPIPLETSVASLYRDSAGALWIGVDDGSLYRWRGDRLETVLSADGGLGQVRGLAEDAQGRMWIAGSSALARHENGHVIRVTRPEGAVVRSTSTPRAPSGSERRAAAWPAGKTTTCASSGPPWACSPTSSTRCSPTIRVSCGWAPAAACCGCRPTPSRRSTRAAASGWTWSPSSAPTSGATWPPPGSTSPGPGRAATDASGSPPTRGW